MLGFATKKDWNRLLEQLEKLKPKAETPQAPEPVETVKSEPEVVQLFEVEVSLNQERIATYRDVTSVWDGMEYKGQLEIFRTCGKVVLKGKDYSYSLTEQKPEAEKALFDYGGVSFLSQIDRHLDRLLDQPVNVRSWTLAREEMEREWTKKYDRVNRVVSGLTTGVYLLQGDVSTLKEITRDQAKTIDALNHRIEMLELRFREVKTMTPAQAKAVSKAWEKKTNEMKKPQPKGAKR